MHDTKTLRKTLLDALDSAGNVLRRYFGKALVEYKGRANLVTQADRASETKILNIILKRFPDHDYITEERAPSRRGSAYSWIIDPLDGTTNYAHGYPVACVSIGLLKGGRPVIGGVYDPFRDELFLAENGVGAFLNGKRMAVSRTKRLSESLLITGFAYDRMERSHFYVEFYRTFMTQCHDVRRSGSASLDLAWIAAGRADGFWEFNLNPWDVAAGWLLVREAGGKVTDFSGNPWHETSRLGYQTLATNSQIHADMLRVFRQNIKPKEMRLV